MIDIRQEGDCSSPGAAATAVTAAERPDVFRPQVQEVQTLWDSAVTHRTREGEEMPTPPVFTDWRSFVNYLRMLVDLFNETVDKLA